MNFAELRFWGYLLTGLLVLVGLRFLLRPLLRGREQVFDKLGLLTLGLVLLLVVSWVTFVIYLVVVAVTYGGLAWILKHHAERAKHCLLLLVPLQLAPLLYYKYGNFIANDVLGLGFDTLRDLVIPVGISFYTFQKVAFVVDTLVFKHPLPRLLDYLNFAGFFPQIVAGPIERKNDLLPQMENFRFRWRPQDIDEGAGWIVLGLFFKCCLADNLAAYFKPSFADNAYQVWLANVLFGLRIYYDFAGYSLIAIGLGRCLGVRLTLNFTSPYCSTNIGEFWRRWHITLSQWFRDYLYVPLGGGRVRCWAFNILLVFVVSGVWHGAGWNFVLWGAMHAAFLILVRLSGKRVLPGPLAWSLTMVAAFSAWLCFYELNTSRMLSKLALLLNPAAYAPGALKATIALFPPGDRFVLAGLFVLVAGVLSLEWLSVRRLNEPYGYFRKKPVLILLVVLTVLLAPGKNNGFIYFAF